MREVLESLEPVIKRHKKYQAHRILERMVEPERQIIFRVPRQDDKGEIHVNRGFSIEFNSAIGPYKDGLRFLTTLGDGRWERRFRFRSDRQIGQ